MILRNKDDPNLELVSYETQYDNLQLRKIYLSWLNDLNITKFISPELYTNNKTDIFIEESFKRFTRNDCSAFFIKDSEKNKFIGTIVLQYISSTTRIAWDGIMIGEKDYHGKKISFKTYLILLEYGFSKLNIYKVMSGCNINNIPMKKTLLNLGYKNEGCFRKVDLIDNIFSDHIYFGIFKKEFRKKFDVNIEIIN